MNQSATPERPKRETASAFAFVPSRDFDGGLLHRWVFSLTRADALAYLRLGRAWPAKAKWALAAWFLAGGAAWGLLPETLTGAEGSWRALMSFLAVIAAQFALLLAGRGIWRQMRARMMVPKPRQAEFEEWIDCVAGTEIDSADCAYLSPELIGQVVETASHIFILNTQTRIVVPKRAFASAAEATAMAAHLRELAAGPYYFDA